MLGSSSKKHPYKIAVLGDQAVGKTALIRRFVNNEFVENYDPTIEDHYDTSLNYEGRKVYLKIIDTAGKDQLPAMRLRHIDNADAFILAYSVESRHSFENTLQILSDIAKRRTVYQIARVLVGCKSDSMYREVTLEEGSELSAQLQCSFAETSALCDVNIYEVFEECVAQLKYVETAYRSLAETRPSGQWYPDKRNSFCCFM